MSAPLPSSDFSDAGPALVSDADSQAGVTNPTQILLDGSQPASPNEHTSIPPNGWAGPYTEELPHVPGYELHGVLGRGGMGVVYKARQIQLNRQVALKMVLAGGHAGPLELFRFRTEAEAVARLKHPNIVQIFEIGEHESRPYCALEYLDGGCLTMRLAAASLPAREAAALVETLARAVQHAHEYGVVHRDLKPANILMTSDGVPKITDFGLAKRIGEESSQTRTGDILGTPSYMAPEQAEGNSKAIGPATDVYALGAILYELLTGRPPFKAETPFETVLQVVNEEPVPPTQLQPKIPRDLGTICLKCLEKESAKRYATARDLADDLRRFLGNMPIRARPVQPWERTWKWAKRRPATAGLLGVSALAVILLATGGMVSYVHLKKAFEGEKRHADEADKQRQRAEKRSLLIRRAVDDMYTQVAEKGLVNELLPDGFRQELLQRALRIYEELADEDSDDPAVRRETALASFRVGEIFRQLTGKREDAEAAYRRAADLQAALAEAYPAEPAYRQDLAETWNWLGELLRTDARRVPEAERAYRAALDLQQQLVQQQPTRPEPRSKLARAYNNLALLSMDRQRADEAATEFGEAIRLLTELHAQQPEDRSHGRELARVYINRGLHHEGAKRATAAEGDYRAATDLLSKLRETWQQQPDAKRELAVAHNNLGILLAGKKNADARREYDQALALLHELVRDFPLRAAFRCELANTHNNLGALAYAEQNTAAALQAWKTAFAVFEQLADADVADAEYRFRLAQTAGNLGWLHNKRGESEQARPYLEKSVRTLEAILCDDPQNMPCLQLARLRYRDLATLHLASGDHAAAAQTAATLARGAPNEADQLLHAARIYGRCALLVLKDTRLNEAGRQAARGYGDQAVSLLAQAGRLGLKEWNEIKKDPDFDALRDRKEFRSLPAR